MPEENIKENKPSSRLRGFLYKKISGMMKREEDRKKKGKKLEGEFPKFYVKKPENVVLPTISNIVKINVSYDLIQPFASVNIKWDPVKKEAVYNVLEPKLTGKEKNTLKKISDALMSAIDIDLSAAPNVKNIIYYLEEKIRQIRKDYGVDIDPESYPKIMYYLYRNFVGLNEIEAFMQDPNIEDISCDGLEIPLYIIHRKYGSMKTNVIFHNIDDLREFIVKLAERSGRYVSYAEPILDSTLPDGSRIAATLATDVATRGSTFTIRKFSENPFSPIDQIDLNTASTEMMAYLWYLIQHKASGIIVGSTASGKTSFLNSISMFVPPEAKIVSIEDTRELKLAHDHWISGLARVGFGVPSPTGEKYGEVTLFDLLRETFRQNPDYVIVGETRGEETYVMFQGMASGHSSLSTFHAGSLDTLVKRLTTPPINLFSILLESLNFVIIMTHAKEKGASARRLKEMIEIISVDPRTNEIATNITFRWDPLSDKYEKVNESVAVRRIAGNIGASYEDAVREIERRKLILDWLVKRGSKNYIEVTTFINEYYKEPESALATIGKFIPLPKLTAKIPMEEKPKEGKRKKFSSILELLGFKMVREKKNA